MGFGVHPMRMVRVYEPFCYSVYLYVSVRVPSFVVTECSIVTSVVLAIFTNRLFVTVVCFVLLGAHFDFCRSFLYSSFVIGMLVKFPLSLSGHNSYVCVVLLLFYDNHQICCGCTYGTSNFRQ